jgi:hypothetical protein
MPAFMGSLDLSQARLVAQGGVRFVYEHDDFPGMLIKVYKPDAIDDEGHFVGKKRKRMKFRRRLGAFVQVNREIAEFLAFQARRSNRGEQWPIAKMFGFVETEIGLGVLTQKLTAPDGGLAPTLVALVRGRQFSPRHRAALQRFLQDLEERHICMCDPHPSNIVFAGDIESGGRFVAIDGLGAKTLLPVRDWFKFFNARRTRRNAQRIWKFVDGGGKASTEPAPAVGLAGVQA